jgi:membrane protease subunit HflC
VVDVRFKRLDLPTENSASIYDRMKSQRAQEAANWRAQGQREARALRAEADKQVVITLAEARRQAEVLRGEGDAEATRLPEASARDPSSSTIAHEGDAGRP